jgi:GINS complex subunit 3
MLAVSRSSTTGTNLTLDLPSSLSNKVTNALKADARTVELRSLAPHFYALGARLLDLFEDDELADTLTGTFRSRAREIADMAYNSRNVGEGAEFLRGLDEEERQLFRMAHDGAKSVRIWMTELKKS